MHKLMTGGKKKRRNEGTTEQKKFVGGEVDRGPGMEKIPNKIT